MTERSEPLLPRPSLQAGFVALFFFLTMTGAAIRELHRLLPAYPDSLAPLRHPVDYPLTGLMILTPLFYTSAIYFLTAFGLSSRGGVGGTFNRASLSALRVAGICIGLGVVVDIARPFIVHWVAPDALMESQSIAEIFMLAFVGGTLTTLSKNGNILFRHAHKLRNDLDEIV